MPTRGAAVQAVAPVSHLPTMRRKISTSPPLQILQGVVQDLHPPLQILQGVVQDLHPLQERKKNEVLLLFKKTRNLPSFVLLGRKKKEEYARAC
jgi:hypothetical protein